MSISQPEENFSSYPNINRYKIIRRHGRKIAVPKEHVDTVIDDNQQCPICFQYSMYPLFDFRSNEHDYGQPLSHAVVPSANLVVDDRSDYFSPETYHKSLSDNVNNARTAMECLNTRCPNRDTGMRFRQSKTLEDTEL